MGTVALLHGLGILWKVEVLPFKALGLPVLDRYAKDATAHAEIAARTRSRRLRVDHPEAAIPSPRSPTPPIRYTQ